ncbi:MAG: sirohydrochlorin cobaltochelatase [Candidatus Adiutrix sp.]|nr:sirohydrochlorin cobaltochelatase [Candidatus Adiutrix sp.]
MTRSSLKFNLFLAALLAPVLMLPALGRAYDREPQKTAVVLSAFGTTEVEALGAILNVRDKVRAAFPDHDVHLAFTSNIIRGVWRQRAADADFRKANQIPEEIYSLGNPLTTLALIQEGGSRPILVQSLHITNGSEFGDLKKIVTQLAGIDALQESKKPFPYLALGDSALGGGGEAELNRAAKALAPLVEDAKTDRSALLLMGHGNEHLDVKAYRDFAAAMNKMYNYPVFLGLVEGSPGYDDILKALKEAKVKSLLLAPFMLVAGDHAKNDLAGDEEDSWASMLKAEGFSLRTRLTGLGALDSWAEIYVERLKALEAELKKAAQ